MRRDEGRSSLAVACRGPSERGQSDRGQSERGQSSEIPVFFGGADEPVFGVLHLPACATVRGAVAICPPLGVEALSAHKGLRRLACRLAAGGIAALRFDYRGTGDSAGSAAGSGCVEAWTADICAALSLLRSLRAERVGVVGLRMGALLAARAAARAGVDAAALWDPCSSGRSFVREQVALRALSIGPSDSRSGDARPRTPAVSDPAAGAPQGADQASGSDRSGGTADGAVTADVEVLGAVLDGALVAELEAFELAGLESRPAPAVLALVRAERAPNRRLVAPLARWQAEVTEAAGQPEFVDALPDSSAVPEHTLELLDDWLQRQLGGGPPSELDLGHLPRAEARFAEHGALICERARHLGPLGLFAVESAPAEGARGPTMLFLNAGLIHHTGPSRLWVDLSRRLAAGGMRAVRIDLSGLGESPTRPGQRRELVYPLEALEDIAAAVKALEEDNPDGVVLSGLCAGAYHSIEGGIALGARGVVAINPFLNFDPEEVREGGELASDRNAVRPYDGWIKPLMRYRWLVDLGDRRVPAAVWWVLSQLGLYTSPAIPIERLAERDVRVLLVCGDLESRQFTRRGRWTMRRLERSGLVQLKVLPGSDHTLFGAEARAEATAVVCEFVLSHFGRASAPGCDDALERRRPALGQQGSPSPAAPPAPANRR